MTESFHIIVTYERYYERRTEKRNRKEVIRKVVDGGNGWIYVRKSKTNGSK